MKLQIFFRLLLIVVNLGLLDGCSHRHEDHHVRKFRHKMLREMGMKEDQIKNIGDESIDEAKQLLPMMNVHEPEDKKQTRYVIEKDQDDLLADEHLFELPDAVAQRDLLNVFVNFHVRPVLNAEALVTIDVKAREITSETFTYIGSQEINAYSEVKKLRMKLDTEMMKRWFTDSAKSIILSFEMRDSETNLIINKDDEDADGKRIMLELAMATRSRKKRAIETKCKEGTDGQECCIKSKIVKFHDIGMKNVLSPEVAEISWCEGACTKESSFEKLFSVYNTMMHHDNSSGEACCHGVSSSHIDILFTNADGELSRQRVYDVGFTECRCA